VNLPTALLVSLDLVGGLFLIIRSAPRTRRPRLAARLEPYLRGLRPARSRLLAVPDEIPLAGVPELLRPTIAAGARMVDRWLGGATSSTSVARRLREAGRGGGVARFRAEQVLWGLAGFAAGLVAGLALPSVLGRGVMPLASVGLTGVGALLGVLARDWWLGREVVRRQARVLAEFPTIADLLCLAVTAGETPRAALERVTRWAHGELADELAQVLAEVRAGTPLAVALEHLQRRIDLPQVAGFVDGLVVAMERGTPLADVLRAQAADVREHRKRELIETGGRREVFMLLPVVFLVLPVVVLFALYPGLLSLSSLAP
jgi:tight adherence protein C